jgi:hypothetical protein
VDRVGLGRKSGDDDKTTGGQIWIIRGQGGEARLTTRKGAPAFRGP